MSQIDTGRRWMIVIVFAVLLSMLGVSAGPARADGLPAPWASMDVGNTGVVGSASYADGMFTLAGGGDGIGGGYDQFQFVNQPLNGDGQIVARLTNIQNGKPGTEAGLIIRETRDGWPPAREALARLNSAGEMAFEYRAEPQTDAATVTGAPVATPVWLKLTRQGNTFTGFSSPDGVAWVQLGSATIAMGANVSVGLAASGNTYGTLATATFDQVTVLSAPPAPWISGDVGNTGAAGSAGYVNGQFVVSGAGDEVGGSYDQFQFVSQPISGDAQVIARIVHITSDNPNTKAAVIIRETRDGWPPAREVIVGLRQGNGAFFAARSEPQGFADLLDGPALQLRTGSSSRGAATPSQARFRLTAWPGHRLAAPRSLWAARYTLVWRLAGKPLARWRPRRSIRCRSTQLLERRSARAWTGTACAATLDAAHTD